MRHRDAGNPVGAGDGRPRVGVLARVAPCSWTAHYVNAFRAVCDAVVVGPPPDTAFLAGIQREEAAHLAPAVDVPCDFDDSPPLASLWPAGWRPDLVVGIAGLGGLPLHPGVNALRCPTAFLSIDTWQCLGDYGEARAYDAVFCAQRSFAPRLRDAGSRHVAWLPLACDPAAHHPVDVAPTHDIAFAGSASLPVHAARRALLEALGRTFSLNARGRVYGGELCRHVGTGRLAFNHCAVREVNMRVFEAMAMGRPLLNNAEAAENGLLDLFGDGVHLAVYDGEDGLLRTARALLGDPARAARMAAEARELVLAEHTYAHRARTVIDTMAALGRGRATGDAAAEPVAPLDWLPTLPGRVLDMGLGLRASRHAARRHGAAGLDGIAWDTETAAARRGSYDNLARWPEAPGDRYDTAVIADAATPDPDAAVRAAGDLLETGGVLVWRVAPDTVAALDAAAPGAVADWLAARGFVVRRVGAPMADGASFIQARKRARPVADIVAGAFAGLDVPELNVPALLARIPRGY